ncbi:hypothetical protein E2I00_002074 [Balaenoptera physalus]|uniref:Uncharacterized protein n=1 Tax=Balaenoptera physalus TaxID=9770 RepID=A0A643BVF1_BALPH|nr:hypothetical protein E2I00_002074 [Balaenoptera physalus]
MASSGAGVIAAGSANEAPEIPDNMGDWLRGELDPQFGTLCCRSLAGQEFE